MNIAILVNILKFFLILVSTLEGEGSLDTSTMPQKPMKINPISNLNLKRLKFSSLNLITILTSLFSNDAIHTLKDWGDAL